MRRVAIIIVALFLLLAGGGYGYFLYKTQGINRNQSEVEALAAELLPGARPIPGTKGVAALDKDGMRIAVLAPSLLKARPDRLGGEDLRFLIIGLGKPTSKDDLEKMRAQIASLQEQMLELGINKLDSKPALLQVGGRPHPAMETSSEIRAGGPKLTEYITLFSPRKDAVLLVITGPQATFNKAGMQQFLDGLEASKSFPEGDGLKERIGAEVREEVKERVGEAKAEARERAEERAGEVRSEAREKVKEQEAALKEKVRREAEAKVKAEVESKVKAEVEARAKEAAERKAKERLDQERDQLRERREDAPGPLRRLRDR